MRIKMKQFRQIQVLTVASFLSVLFFQNCGQYALQDSLVGLDSVSACVGLSCPTTADALMIRVGNQDPAEITTSEASIDVGGFCNSGGFNATKFYYEIHDNGTGNILGAPMSAQQGCTANGRFQISVALPPGYNYGLAYYAVIYMRGINPDGSEVENPSGLSRAQLDIRTFTN
jgi:hypothetical protein